MGGYSAVLLGLGLSSASFGAPLPSIKSPPATETQEGACTVHEISRERLVLNDGHTVYVEPNAFEANGAGEALLVGRHNLLFREHQHGQWEIIPQDSVLGVVLSFDGEKHLVTSPIPTSRLARVRALANADGWTVAFLERGTSQGGSPGSVTRAWVGTLKDREWVRVDSLPSIAPGVHLTEFASSLVEVRDTLYWAVRADFGLSHNVVLFSQHGGRWSYEVVPTRTVADVELGHLEPIGLAMAVVQPDASLRSDGNSLFLWTKQPDWKPSKRLVRGSVEGRVYRPRMSSSGEGAVLTWVSRSGGGAGLLPGEQVRMMAGALHAGARRQGIVDSGANAFGMLPLVGNSYAWLTVRQRQGIQGGELRLVVAAGGDRLVNAWNAPNPFVPDASVGVASLSPSEIMISGPFQVVGAEVIATVFIRLRAECRRA